MFTFFAAESIDQIFRFYTQQNLLIQNGHQLSLQEKKLLQKLNQGGEVKMPAEC